MMKRLIVFSAVVVLFITVPPVRPQCGAKALFVDPTSDVAIATTKGSKPDGCVKKQEPSGATPARASNIGLMYYVELVKPSGEIMRVNSDRTFHSGERVRIHFESNIEGRLVILQKHNDGTSQALFPDPRVRNGDNHIKANQDTVIPSEKAWFAFDNHPGEERLIVFLTTEAGYSQVGAALTDGTLSVPKTIELASNIQQQKGAKDLFIQVDDKSDQQATYVVKTAMQKQETPPSVGTEIILHHQ